MDLGAGAAVTSPTLQAKLSLLCLNKSLKHNKPTFQLRFFFSSTVFTTIARANTTWSQLPIWLPQQRTPGNISILRLPMH